MGLVRNWSISLFDIVDKPGIRILNNQACKVYRRAAVIVSHTISPTGNNGRRMSSPRKVDNVREMKLKTFD